MPTPRIPRRRFYRAWLVPPAPPGFTVLEQWTTNLTLIRVDSALLPYAVGVSTNQGQWTALETNFALGEIQTSAASAIGNADRLSTFLTASQPEIAGLRSIRHAGILGDQQFASRQFLDSVHFYQDQRPDRGRGRHQSVCAAIPARLPANCTPRLTRIPPCRAVTVLWPRIML